MSSPNSERIEWSELCYWSHSLSGVQKAGFALIDNGDYKTLHDCLTCGDIRYTNHDDALILDVFMKNEGVIREESAFTIPLPTIYEDKGYYGNGDVQVKEKAILTSVLEDREFDVEGYELPCNSGEADLIATTKDGITVIGEVGACRVTKVYQTLQTPPWVEKLENMELWHLPYPKIDYSNRLADCRLFIYRRGRNWDGLQNEYELGRMELLGDAFREIKSTD